MHCERARCCQKVNLQPVSYVLQPLASAKAVLSRDETELGVALVDIGGGTTDIAIFHNGSIVHTAVLPLGGSHVSQDLAIGLRTPQTEAERLKIAAGCALKTMISSSETVEVPSVGGRPARVVDRKLLGEIIEPRFEEILQMVNREIISSGYADTLGAGVVLTGGSTLMSGVIELAEFVFDLPVKRAAPMGLAGFGDIVSTPIYSTSVGLLHWGVADRSALQRKSNNNQTSQKIKDQFKTWFGDLF
jgi:cell division protein FtsA